MTDEKHIILTPRDRKIIRWTIFLTSIFYLNILVSFWYVKESEQSTTLAVSCLMNQTCVKDAKHKMRKFFADMGVIEKGKGGK